MTTTVIYGGVDDGNLRSTDGSTSGPTGAYSVARAGGTIYVANSQNPYDVALTNDGTKLYVAIGSYSTLQTVRTADMTVQSQIALAAAPNFLALNSDESVLYASLFSNNTVVAIRTSDMTVQGTASLGASHGPQGLVVSSDNSTVYVACSDANTVEAIRTSDMTVQGTASLGASHSPQFLAISSDDATVYSSNYTAATVEAIRTSDMTVQGTVSTGSGPQGLAITSDNATVYVACRNVNTVLAVRTSDMTVQGTASLGSTHGPISLVLNSNETTVYTVNYQASNVEAVRTSDMTVQGTASLGASHGPRGAAISGDNAIVYVANSGISTVKGIRTSDMTVQKTASLGGNGITMQLGQQSVTVSATQYLVWETFHRFETSVIPDTDYVSSAVLSITPWSDNSTTDFTIQARLASNYVIDPSGWVPGANLSGMTLLGEYSTASGFSAAVSFSDTAMAANINKTGSTPIMLSSSRTADNLSPSGDEYVQLRQADYSGTSSDPKLTLTHVSTIPSAGVSVVRILSRNFAG